jgi:hypothetical protein
LWKNHDFSHGKVFQKAIAKIVLRLVLLYRISIHIHYKERVIKGQLIALSFLLLHDILIFVCMLIIANMIAGQDTKLLKDSHKSIVVEKIIFVEK